jgi:hypothetical protein
VDFSDGSGQGYLFMKFFGASVGGAKYAVRSLPIISPSTEGQVSAHTPLPRAKAIAIAFAFQ